MEAGALWTLDDDSPVEQLAAGNARAVLSAASSYVNAGRSLAAADHRPDREQAKR